MHIESRDERPGQARFGARLVVILVAAVVYAAVFVRDCVEGGGLMPFAITFGGAGALGLVVWLLMERAKRRSAERLQAAYEGRSARHSRESGNP